MALEVELDINNYRLFHQLCFPAGQCWNTLGLYMQPTLSLGPPSWLAEANGVACEQGTGFDAIDTLVLLLRLLTIRNTTLGSF